MESFLTERIGAQPTLGMRNITMESLFAYGSRAGFWRLYRAFTARRVPVTVYRAAMALERNPAAVAAMLEADWDRNASLPLDRGFAARFVANYLYVHIRDDPDIRGDPRRCRA